MANTMNESPNESSGRIEPLKKVVLSLEVGTTPEQMDLTPQPFHFEFIHGLGTTGLSPFEQMLAGKGPGDEISMQIPMEAQKHFLGHLVFPPILFPSDLKVLHLKARVEKVSTATSREVVQGLAKGTECGDGCCGH